MDMTNLERAVKNVAAEELERANQIHGPHTSSHQAFAVLKEELEEGEEKKKVVDAFANNLWRAVKNDDLCGMATSLNTIEENLTSMNAEFSQALAMVYKFKSYIVELNRE